MNRYAVYNENDGFMFSVNAESEAEALSKAKEQHKLATSVKLVSEDVEPREKG